MGRYQKKGLEGLHKSPNIKADFVSSIKKCNLWK